MLTNKENQSYKTWFRSGKYLTIALKFIRISLDSLSAMDTNIPNQNRQNHFYDFDDFPNHTDFPADEDHHSDFEEDETYDFESDPDCKVEGIEAIRQARKSGRWCQKCTKSFETIEAYRFHLKRAKVHHLCQFCDNFKDYRSLKNLQLHWQKSHSSIHCEFCSKTFSSPKDKQTHFDSQHVVCERCTIWFESKGRRRYHWASSDAHKDTYCKLCKLDFADSSAYDTHFHTSHRPEPRKGEGTGNDTGEEYKDQKENATTGSSRKFYKDSNYKEGKTKTRAPPDHYAMLKIPSKSSAEEIKKASRQRRIEVHPDRLKKHPDITPKDAEAIDTLAKNVGFAAEVLGNETLRRQYDRIYRVWYSE